MALPAQATVIEKSDLVDDFYSMAMTILANDDRFLFQ